MANAKKKQTELAGMERETIEVLDDACTTHLKAAKAAKKAKDKAEQAKSDVKACMKDNLANLNKDADGNHVYPYADGDQEKVFVLRIDEVLSVRNAEKPQLESVSLED